MTFTANDYIYPLQILQSSVELVRVAILINYAKHADAFDVWDKYVIWIGFLFLFPATNARGF